MTAPDLGPANYPAEPPAVDLDAIFLLPGDCDCGHEEIQHEHGGRCEACGDETPCYEYDPDGEVT